jgi:SP family myo-inositol transporter-like MFS transporter 13
MVVGRSIVGLAVGAASFVVPLYIAELSPAPFRGRLVTLTILFVTIGQVVSYVIGYLFSEYGKANGWRWMVGLGAAPAGVQFVVLIWMPESPRWLVKAGKRDEARGVLNKVFGRGIDIQKMVDVVLRDIETEVQEEEEVERRRSRNSPAKKNKWLSGANLAWNELFRIGGNRRALVIACLLQGLQQLCGFVSSSMYVAKV